MMAVVQASRTKCGYTKVHDVTTGERGGVEAAGVRTWRGAGVLETR
jgi:hypothetical protein